MLAQALWVVFFLITTPVLIFINWMLWFYALPLALRQARDQYRRVWERKRPN